MFANAQEMYEQATAINEKTHGPEHPDTASSISGSALVLKDMGQLDAALGKYNQVLRIQEKTLGRNHLEVANTQNNIGEVFRQQAKYPEALEMFQKSLATKVLGLEHPLVAENKIK